MSNNDVIGSAVNIAYAVLGLLREHFMVSVLVMAVLCALAYRGMMRADALGHVESTAAALLAIGLFIGLAPHEADFLKVIAWMVMALYAFATVLIDRDRPQSARERM